MKEEADLLFRGLCSELESPVRKQLIQLVDIQDARREKNELYSFISGFKLAWLLTVFTIVVLLLQQKSRSSVWGQVPRLSLEKRRTPF